MTNLAIHLLTAFVAFALVRLLVRHRGGIERQRHIGSSGTVGIWAVHPFQRPTSLRRSTNERHGGLAMIFRLGVLPGSRTATAGAAGRLV